MSTPNQAIERIASLREGLPQDRTPAERQGVSFLMLYLFRQCHYYFEMEIYFIHLTK